MPPKKDKQQSQNLTKKRTPGRVETREMRSAYKRQNKDEETKNEDPTVNKSDNDSNDPNAEKFIFYFPNHSSSNKSKYKKVIKQQEKNRKQQKHEQQIYVQEEYEQSTDNHLLNEQKREGEMLNKVIGSDSELNEIEENEMLADGPLQISNDDVAKQQNGGKLESSIKPEKIKKEQFLCKESIEYINKISNGFRKECKTLNLRQHPPFQDWQRDQIKKLKTWYKRQQSKETKSDFVVPQIEYANEILMGFFNNTIPVKEEHRTYIAHLLEQVLPSSLQSYYANYALNSVLREIEEHSDDIFQLVLILEKTPTQIRLKATAQAIQHLQNKQIYTDDHKRSWFNNCIKPALSSKGKINYQEFDDKDVQLIKELCEFSGLRHLTDSEAINYLTLLQNKKLFDLDSAAKDFIDKDTQTFWIPILVDICHVALEIAKIWVEYKKSMITSAILYHYRVSGVNRQFSQYLAHFNKMTLDEIACLYKLKEGRNFIRLISCLESKRVYDYSEFYRQSVVYMELDNESQIKSFQDILSNTSLEQWMSFKNQIMATSSFLDDDEALEKVRHALQDAQAQFRLQVTEVGQLRLTSDYWDLVYCNLLKLRKFREFQWQKELVIYLTNLIVHAFKKNIIITLSTGHGKSLIIQLLADILVQYNQKVIVVCTNNFLAHWSRMQYGSQNVRDERIIYMSLAHFLKREPDHQIHVIFDEIDQMLGVDSFSLIEDEIGESQSITRAVFNASLMKQWKSVIGLSGTISQSTISSIKTELTNSICIDIPSLRMNGSNNKVSKVIKVDDNDSDLFNAVCHRIKELQSKQNNFIVVFKDKDHLELFQTNASLFITQNADMNCIIFNHFDSKFSSIEKKLNDVAKDSFLILTTKEGARGVDYKGVHSAHVIIAFKPESYSETVQALGRGCRELTSFAEGSIICKDPLTLDAADYLQLLQSDDDEKSQSLRLNSKIARMLHHQVVPTGMIEKEAEAKSVQFDNKPFETFYWFQHMMKRGDNFLIVEWGQILWKELRKYDKSGKMPQSYYQHESWNQ